jgi:hypothetical protein
MFMNNNNGTSFLILMFGIIMLSGFVFKQSFDRLGAIGLQSEGLENMQRQNFNLAPGAYPETLDALLLNPEYPTPGSVINVAPDAANSSSSSSSSGGTAVSDYPDLTNNSRYRSNPDNDTCMPMTMCNSFYGLRNERQHPPPPPIELSDSRKRVNYYAADTV